MRSTSLALMLAIAATACTESDSTAPATPPQVQFAAAPAFGTATDLEDLLGLPSSTNASGWDRGFRQQVSAQIGNLPAVERAFQRWLTTLINARLKPANTDLELYSALTDYLAWLEGVESVLPDPVTPFVNEIDSFHQVVADRLARAIDGNLTVCRTSQSFAALANVLMWYDQAVQLDLPATPYWSITDDALTSYIQQFCLAVEVQSIAFPNPVNVGQSFTLSTTAAVRFVGQPTTVPAAFEMNIAYTPGIPLVPAYTDAAGFYQTPVTFTAAGFITVRAVACLVIPGRTLATRFACGLGSETGNVIDPTPPPPPPPPPPVDVSGVWEADFSYTGPTGQNFVPARIRLTLTQSGTSAGGLWVLDDGVHAGSMSFTVGGIDPACPGCGYLITNFDMTGGSGGRWFLRVSSGGGHVGDPARGLAMVMDLFGTDSHGTDESTHVWFDRRVMFRPVDP